MEDYIRGCTTSNKYCSLSTNWRLYPRLCYFYLILTAFNKLMIMSEVVLLLPITNRFQQVEDYIRDCTASTKYSSLSTSRRLYPRLYYFYQILIAFSKLKIMSEVILLLTKYWLPSTSWRLYQRLYHFYQILTAFNKLKIMSEVVLLLPNTDRFQQVEDYVRGWTTSTKYWPLSTSWRLYPRLCYFYQILTTFNKLKIMSKVVLLLTKILTAFNKLKIMSEVVPLLPNTDHFLWF